MHSHANTQRKEPETKEEVVHRGLLGGCLRVLLIFLFCSQWEAKKKEEKMKEHTCWSIKLFFFFLPTAYLNKFLEWKWIWGSVSVSMSPWTKMEKAVIRLSTHLPLYPIPARSYHLQPFHVSYYVLHLSVITSFSPINTCSCFLLSCEYFWRINYLHWEDLKSYFFFF